MKCIACNSVFTTIEYQSRAADEAQSRIETCPNCPLDASKLTLQWKEDAHVHLERILLKEQATPTGDIYNLSRRCLMYIRCSKPSGKALNATCCNILCTESELYRLYDTGPFQGVCVREENVKQIAPEVELHIALFGKCNYTSLHAYTHFEYILQDADETLFVESCGLWYKVMQVDENDIAQQASILREAYMELVTLNSLGSYIPQSLLGSMSNLSSRGYDLNQVEDSEYNFTVKADGERLWVTLVGCVWLYSRRLLGHKIVGWVVDEQMLAQHKTCYGPTLDVEVFIGHRPVLIDILMTEDSCVSPRGRNIVWVHIEFLDMAARMDHLNTIQTREIHSSYSDAAKVCNTVPYPTDGVVALPHDGMDIVKLKAIKSMELEATSNGDMVSSEGIRVVNVSKGHAWETGCIYEIGMYVHHNQCVFTHMFRRPDKTKANSIAAIHSIVESSLPQQKDKALRTQLWRCSNKAREEVYKLACKRMPGRRLILDVGTGDGQSCDVHSKMPDCSFVLVEPDEFKCIKLMKRLQLKSYETNPRSLIRKVASLKKGNIRYCIVNCKLESILEDKDVCAMLLPELKCCVACFSLQFILPSMHILTSHSVQTIGMCYTYDGVEVGGHIMNSGDISMTKISECTAQVKWGNDSAYEEPAVEKSDFPCDATLLGVKSLMDFSCVSGCASELMDRLIICISN